MSLLLLAAACGGSTAADVGSSGSGNGSGDGSGGGDGSGNGGGTGGSGGTGTGTSGTSSTSPSSSTTSSMPDTDDACKLVAATTKTSTVSTNGCAVLSRDTSYCHDQRVAAGLSGFWLDVSCRVTLSVANGKVTAVSDDRPDYKSFYFPTSDPCYEAWPSGMKNPNTIASQSLSIDFPLSPSGGSQTMHGAIVGMAVNGVGIFGNFAAPGDDIYEEAKTFDRCAAHPQDTGVYHYHAEPLAITQDDDAFVGVMRDGYPVYGRKDADGTYPTLDTDGGHTGTTKHSATPVYHYHVNLQTSTGNRTAGQQQWFLTTGRFHGQPATCSTCDG